MTGPALHTHRHRLSYADTDPAGILYYAAWFPRMEALQTEFFYMNDLRQDTLRTRFGWWTVSRETRCEFLAAAMLFDLVRIDLRLGAIGTSSFRFDFTMTRENDDVVVSRASNTLVTVSPDQRTVRIPDLLRRRLEEWSPAENAA